MAGRQIALSGPQCKAPWPNTHKTTWRQSAANGANKDSASHGATLCYMSGQGVLVSRIFAWRAHGGCSCARAPCTIIDLHPSDHAQCWSPTPFGLSGSHGACTGGAGCGQTANTTDVLLKSSKNRGILNPNGESEGSSGKSGQLQTTTPRSGIAAARCAPCGHCAAVPWLRRICISAKSNVQKTKKTQNQNQKKK